VTSHRGERAISPEIVQGGPAGAAIRALSLDISRFFDASALDLQLHQNEFTSVGLDFAIEVAQYRPRFCALSVELLAPGPN
jgi:hypothetical protein